jgi:hypothetical protein
LADDDAEVAGVELGVGDGDDGAGAGAGAGDEGATEGGADEAGADEGGADDPGPDGWLGTVRLGDGPPVGDGLADPGAGAGGGGAGAGTAPTTRVAPKNADHQMCATLTTSPLFGASIM